MRAKETELKERRGGKRAGAGRKKGSKASETMESVFVRLPHDVIERIDRQAKAQGINRSRYIREQLSLLK